MPLATRLHRLMLDHRAARVSPGSVAVSTMGAAVAADRVEGVQQALAATIAGLPTAPPHSVGTVLAPGLTVERAVATFEDMVLSRLLDVAARRLKAAGLGHYTISSAGHERMALVGALTRVTDPALLHYRDGALVMARHRRAGSDPVLDTMRSFVADAREGASGGRHKVWGSAPLWIVPQTSTIASHIPKATGLALAISRAARLGWDQPVPPDSVVVASMGDASINHASALSGVNAAAYARRRGVGVPLLMVVEDNGLGISTPTPGGWVEAWAQGWPHVGYVRVAEDLITAWQQIDAAVARVRVERAPLILHLPTVRLWGHAGSDVEAGYRTPQEIREDEARDPVADMARQLVALGAADAPSLIARLAAVATRVDEAEAQLRPVMPLTSRTAVLASLVEHDEQQVRDEARDADPGDRAALYGGTVPEDVTQPARRTLAAWTNATLYEVMASRPQTVVLGQDVGRKGGVYGVTAGLQDRFGAHRVVDTLLDETSILGSAQGAGLLGQLPIVEIQYLAYLHNAIDQLRGEAASTRFFSDGQYRTPMVLRTASFADAHGFGGHFHNDHAVAALREIPGIAIAVPSRGDQAVGLLRAAVAMAARHGRIVVVLEPTALYHRRDLLDEGDDRWTSEWPGAELVLPPGTVGHMGPADADVLIVTAGNGVPLSLRAARDLAGRGVRTQVLDVRWLSPLPVLAVLKTSQRIGKVLIVDECRASAGWADAMVAGLVEAGCTARIATVRAADSYVPIGAAAPLVLIDQDEIVDAAADLASS
jgi:2-oxoisovalerate dehydrogenase E1 component